MVAQVREENTATSPLTGHDWWAGERPDWWVSSSSIWTFTGPGLSFATSDLDNAVERLCESAVIGLDTARGELLQRVPRNAGDHAELFAGTVGVQAHHLHPFLRTQVRALIDAEVRLSAFRDVTVGDILRAVASLLCGPEPMLADRVFDPDEPLFYLALESKQLLAWARAYNAHEVIEFVKRWQKDGAEQRRREAAKRAEAVALREAHRAQRGRAKEECIARLVRYFSFPDFEPENEEEAEAFRLHRLIATAATAAEEELLHEARDAYIAEILFPEPGTGAP